MKIAFLADAPYVHTRRWVDHFVALGHACDVISFRPAEIAGARVHYVDGVEALGKARYLVHARRVQRLIETLQPDIVHALHLTSYGFLGALAGVRPLVVSVWGTDVLEAPRLTPFHAWLTRYALARADYLTATGLHLATETTRYAPHGKPVTVVPYGVDLERFVPKEHAARDEVVIGTAARLSTEKGVSYLVEAFALLRQGHGGRVRLRIAGDGPERGKVDELIRRHGLGESVEMPGWVEHAALPAFLQDLDVFALPSLFEGFGVAAVEASACGLPVVASNLDGIPDVVRDAETGLLVPSKDPAALAAALSRLVDDAAARQRFGSAGREFVARRYDWRENAAQMERLYERALAGRTKEVRA